MSIAHLSVADLVERLELVRHPEGGWFRETFRDEDHHNGRAHSTAIYYLLPEGEVSVWHRVDATEVWHYHAGAALELRLSTDGHTARQYRLGPDPVAGDAFQVVVPRHVWQTARSLGPWTLAGCTVAPAFHFNGFETAGPDFAPG